MELSPIKSNRDYRNALKEIGQLMDARHFAGLENRRPKGLAGSSPVPSATVWDNFQPVED